MIKINHSIKPECLDKKLKRLWELAGEKVLDIEKKFDYKKGAPVFTVKGKYTSRGWTEWTQGFQFGSALLCFDSLDDKEYLEIGRKNVVSYMAGHLTHFGVHDHGFNNVSTYGNLLRLMNEERIKENEWERNFYELALKVSGAVQAKRWTEIKDGGYIYSFNGPHSLFADTIRSLRALAVAHQLGQGLLDENDKRISLLERIISHARTTAKYAVYYGEGRDSYDLRGRVAHESIFNLNDGNYRCPNSQQGYSPFSTWTRGLAWIMCGYAEELEFIDTLPEAELKAFGGKKQIAEFMLKTALAVCDFYIENSPSDGIPYWDTGAPSLHKIEDYLDKPADPFNDCEPVDSSAAAIGAQGLLRLGKYLQGKGKKKEAAKYMQAGLTVADALFDAPYLSDKSSHQGLILHSVYHQPNGWDYVPPKSKIPYGESSMWGDYHAMELALLIQRLGGKKPYYTFYIK
ncbi:MAG: glycosyl hydrolase [Lentisphaerae bacterium GWF2_44_16]|nr:MAG: glycosyl hydrolase [Lentisphaerae bacterium GWF2_44_16]